jgi:hypothetical protein
MMVNDKCGAVQWIIGKGYRIAGRKPAPVQLCPPQIPYALTREWTRAASVGSRRLTSWATARSATGYYCEAAVSMWARIRVNGSFYLLLKYKSGVRGSVVVKALCYKPEGRGFETQWGEWFLSSYLILLVALGPGVYSASNRNEYQKHKNNVSGE